MSLILENLALAASATAYSQAIEMGENNAIGLGATMAAGSVVPTVTVEGSNDLTNWSGTGITNSITITASPSYVSGSASAITTRYARIKVAASTGAILISISANPQRV